MPKKKRAKFDAAKTTTDRLIRLLENGVPPWRQPWKGTTSRQPLRHCGEAYKGVNNFLLSIETMIHGYTSPYWMTYPQAEKMDAQVRKGEKGSLVIYYGTAEANDTDDNDRTNVYRFLKSYRVFNANQIDGLDDKYHPEAEPVDLHPNTAPIPHMQNFFEQIGGNVCFTGRDAYYMPATDRIYMPEIGLFESAEAFYSVWGHEYSHWTKAEHRLNRDYGHSRFGNTSYAREEITAELATVFLGQHLGFGADQLPMNAAYLKSWLSVLRADKNAIFKQAADAQKACDYLISKSHENETTKKVAA